MTTPNPVYWTGPSPDSCQVCGKTLGASMADAAIKPSGAWAIVDLRCLRLHGFGIGAGKGQLYQKQADGRWLKCEG